MCIHVHVPTLHVILYIPTLSVMLFCGPAVFVVDNIMNLLPHVATNVIFMCKELLILSVNFKLFASLTRLK